MLTVSNLEVADRLTESTDESRTRFHWETVHLYNTGGDEQYSGGAGCQGYPVHQATSLGSHTDQFVFDRMRDPERGQTTLRFPDQGETQT